MAEQLQQALAILRRKQVEARTGLSRSTIYQRIAEGTFPRQISLGRRAVGWDAAAIQTWLQARIDESLAKSGGTQ